VLETVGFARTATDGAVTTDEPRTRSAEAPVRRLTFAAGLSVHVSRCPPARWSAGFPGGAARDRSSGSRWDRPLLKWRAFHRVFGRSAELADRLAGFANLSPVRTAS